MSEVVYPRQYCWISPIGYGLYGQHIYGYREREIDDARSIRDAGASKNRKEDQPSSSSRKKQRTSIPRGRLVQGRDY